jgi:hypothetical protein
MVYNVVSQSNASVPPGDCNMPQLDPLHAVRTLDCRRGLLSLAADDFLHKDQVLSGNDEGLLVEHDDEKPVAY